MANWCRFEISAEGDNATRFTDYVHELPQERGSGPSKGQLIVFLCDPEKEEFEDGVDHLYVENISDHEISGECRWRLPICWLEKVSKLMPDLQFTATGSIEYEEYEEWEVENGESLCIVRDIESIEIGLIVRQIEDGVQLLTDKEVQQRLSDAWDRYEARQARRARRKEKKLNDKPSIAGSGTAPSVATVTATPPPDDDDSNENATDSANKLSITESGSVPPVATVTAAPPPDANSGSSNEKAAELPDKPATTGAGAVPPTAGTTVPAAPPPDAGK